MMFHHAIFRAEGNQKMGVDGAIIGKVEPDGTPIPGTERRLDVDTICCAYGFTPSIDITLHLDCDHFFDHILQAYVPVHDECMRTSQPGVFVAGDITGVGGKPLADFQGIIAGFSALNWLGLKSENEMVNQQTKLKNAVKREKGFARWLWNRYRIRAGLLKLVEADTVICRCENLNAGQLKTSMEDGSHDLYGLNCERGLVWEAARAATVCRMLR